MTDTLYDNDGQTDKQEEKSKTPVFTADAVHGAQNSALLQPLTIALLECVYPAEVVDMVVERGMTVLGARAGLVALVTRDGAELEIVRTSGYAPDTLHQWYRFPLKGAYPLSEVVRIGGAVYLRDSSDWAAKYPDFAETIEEGFQASVSLPLAARQRVFGGIHFTFAEARDFTDFDRGFLEELARQCALALERALLLEEVQRERQEAETARANAEGARERLEFLASASALLAESLDYQTTLNAITRLAVPNLCDWAAVDMLDPAKPGGVLLSLAVAHKEAEEVVWVTKARQRYPIDMMQTGQPLVHVISTGDTVFLPDIPEEILVAAARDEEHLRLIHKLDLRSYLCVPLTVRGKRLGAVTFASTRSSGRVFSPDTVALVEELARRAAVAVDNALLYAQVQEGNLRQRQFLKEMLAGFTEGRLRLCFTEEELPLPLSPYSNSIELTLSSLRLLRRTVGSVGGELEIPQDRLDDFETAVHEAGINAVKYGGGGTARVYGDSAAGIIQVRVEDQGPGIAEELIHRAIEQGYTTAGFGHGMFLMHSFTNRLYLLTGRQGTTVVLELGRTPPEPAWLQP